jgi:hypothetical protein
MVPQPRGERVKQKVPSLAYQYGARYERKVMMDIRRSEEPKGDATDGKVTLITVKKHCLIAAVEDAVGRMEFPTVN